MPERCRPSRHGQALGRVLASWAERGESHGDPCGDCAFRRGAMANEMAATGSQALNCALGIDPAPFGCHHGMSDGLPTKPCAGWLAARTVPDADKAKDLEALSAGLAGFEGDDHVRAEFDAWIAKVDPDDTLNDYQRARLWRRRQHA